MRKGFTLIELAIVVVIVGLVVSGVIAGQELIKQAELQKTIREIKNFNLAWNTFKLKYNGIPGDLTDPERFFPECNNSVGGDGLTVYEGNGDGMLTNDSTQEDSTCVWLHMFNSGLYLPKGPTAEQFFTNSPAEDVDFSTEAYRWASLPIMGEMFALVEFDQALHFVNEIKMQKNRSIQFSDPELMYQIDFKLDDGKPGKGRIRAEGSGGNCFTNWDVVNSAWPTDESEYILTDTQVSCRFIQLID